MSENNLHNINIERSIICSIFYKPELMEEIKDNLKSDTFYHPTHRYIYEAIEACERANSPIDQEIVKDKLIKIGRWDEDAMLEILCTNPLPNVNAYIKVLIEKKQKRELMLMVGELHKKVSEDEDADEIKLWLTQRVEGISSGVDTRAKSFDVIKYEVLNAPPVQLVKTGIGFIDQPLSIVDERDFILGRHGGFETGRFILLMGDPEAGKTMLGVQMMKHISKEELVLFFAFEFTVRNFVRTQLRIEGDKYTNPNLHIIDDGYDISDMTRELHIWKKKGCRFVLIDSQMRVTNSAKKRATSEEVETEKFSIFAKACQKLDIVIIYICQQGKEDAKGGVITPMGSKKGGHEADIIIYLKKDKDSEDRELIFNKNKQTGKHFKKDITFVRESMLFKGITKKSEKGKGDAVPLSPVEKELCEVTVIGVDGTQTRMELK